MIAKWRVSNFKSIREEIELDIAPLTIFAGANSSGKSTFLQPMLLVAQTLAHRVSSRSVVLNGSLTRLGQFDDLKSLNSDVDQISIGWTVQPYQFIQDRGIVSGRRLPSYFAFSRHVLSSISCDIAFDTEVSDGQKEIAQIQPRLLATRLSVEIQDDEEGDQTSFMDVMLANEADIREKQKWTDVSDGEEGLGFLKYNVKVDQNSLDDIRDEYATAELVGCDLNHFLPELVSVGLDRAIEDAKIVLDTLSGDRLSSSIMRRSYRARNFNVPKIVM